MARPIRLLAVDDSLTMRKLLEVVFSRAGLRDCRSPRAAPKRSPPRRV
jgi:hypothetical protein